jgi:DNA-binding NarL/FixJ family response regulator
MTSHPDAQIRVLIADDQRIVREGLVMLLGLLDGIEVVATAETGDEALRLVAEHAVDVILMDLRMPVMDGIEATYAVRKQQPHVQVLVLTTYADDDSLIPALQAGAKGYLTKNTDADTIASAIRSVHAGGTHFGAEIQARLAELATQPGVSRMLPDNLTAREAEVLTMIAQGRSNHDIAADLVVSAATVKTHINRIFSKTRCRDRAQLVSYAYAHKLASPTTTEPF